MVQVLLRFIAAAEAEPVANFRLEIGDVEKPLPDFIRVSEGLPYAAGRGVVAVLENERRVHRRGIFGKWLKLVCFACWW